MNLLNTFLNQFIILTSKIESHHLNYIWRGKNDFVHCKCCFYHFTKTPCPWLQHRTNASLCSSCVILIFVICTAFSPPEWKVGVVGKLFLLWSFCCPALHLFKMGGMEHKEISSVFKTLSQFCLVCFLRASKPAAIIH